ncbi:asparagine synthase-related protein [Natronogracilivirga saccharolytica]|uniref:asparagine synthase (glutamine-hydrolyzing) n=1 Tax=Natronogracilivirga saccharolytica TaxID=2812953 RepID=A0A8J7UVV7_9BACT|nr:hypothetical protein [Natronogracilivirga saccharolytica]
MSDFLYSSKIKKLGQLTGLIHDIYQDDPPETTEFHGNWGSLAVSRNLYNGFQPFENNEHLVVVIGGPVLTYQNNDFLTGDKSNVGSLSLYERFNSENFKWDEDLSGPFTVLIVDKLNSKIQCITDLMLSIPVYKYVDKDLIALGTHIDALAKSCGQRDEIDKVSLTDFILNGVITFPYTAYKKLRQCYPAAIHEFDPNSKPVSELAPELYWEPMEKIDYKNIDEAARDLRKAVSVYISRVTEGMDKVASFLSGGEDSRVVAGMLPNHLKKEAFVFLDYMNREGKIAQKISKAYDLQLNIMFRKPGYYLNILPEASDLVGSGQQYLNAHTLGFHKECKLAEYDAVFGGFIANALLKGYDSRKNKLQKKLSAIYEFITVEEGHSKPVQSDFFKKNVLLEIDRRRSEFLSYLRKFRNNSLHEWFHNWPRSMGQANPGYLVNRRLFRIYEPFLSNEVIKLAAGTPMPWKLNRRLFHKAMRPYLKPAKWVPHGKGWLPYLSWWSNIPIRIFISACRRTGRLTGLITGYHGSWGERSRLLDSLNTEKILSSFGFEMNALEYVIQEPADIDKLTRKQQFNLLQTLYLLNRKTGEKKEVFFHAD